MRSFLCARVTEREIRFLEDRLHRASDVRGSNDWQLEGEMEMIRKLWSRILGLGTLVILLGPALAMGAGGGEVAPLVIVADTRKLDGLFAWWANLYNESHLQFALLTVALIPTIGVVFGVVADIIMSHIGIDLKSRDLAEH